VTRGTEQEREGKREKTGQEQLGRKIQKTIRIEGRVKKAEAKQRKKEASKNREVKGDNRGREQKKVKSQGEGLGLCEVE